jgi:asparagine synthase (glutamine-hydrolysing)
VAQDYLSTSELPVEHLDGSFTVAVLDARAGRVILYRNLAGNGFTYYTVTPDGFAFGSNLAELVERSSITPRVNEALLPAMFLFRFVPGRETLFDGVYRLLPGEQVVFDSQGLRRTQVQTFATLRENPSPPAPLPQGERGALPAHLRQGERGVLASGRNAIDRFEDTVRGVLGHYAEVAPDTANLLSGGVDSSYLQAVWNTVRPGDARPQSFSVSVDHPLTQIDTDYALSAAQALHTQHTLIPARASYADYLLESIATTGEPPNHAMTVYFGMLARAMVERGFSVGLCGEGADSLFGIGAADLLRYAQSIRRWLPWPGVRRWGKALAGAAGRYWLPAAFDVAEHAYDFTHWGHPLNRVAVFADWDAVRACFGDDGVDTALAYRRQLLEQLAVGDDPLECLHAVGYLGEAVDSASLWTTLFNAAGAELRCPYLDSRVLRLALSLPPAQRFRYRRPKDLLKRALARHVPRELAYRFKLGFGQPIFEYLAPGGPLRPWVERIGSYDFVDRASLLAALARPNWFLYSLLCFDIWHKLFIERSLPRERFAIASLWASASGVPLAACPPVVG